VGAGGVSEGGELSQGGLLVVIAEESLLVDDLGGVVNVASDDLDGGGGVALGAHQSLGDSVLGLVLQSHGESSLEILGSGFLGDGDSDLVAGLASVEHTVVGEGGVGPVLAVPLGLFAVELLGNSPDNVL